MHKLAISPAIAERVKARTGKHHPFDGLELRRTALVVIDLQNYFLKPGAQGETPNAARDAMMLNFKVVMVADALAARSDETHNASLSAFYSNFGDVQTVEEVLESLTRGANAKAKIGGAPGRVLRRAPLSKASASL